ncbi:hypothetical protein [Kitasatospora sp. LaBMicrA B282]|uniref:hypothetical protein n=1 Tax=Kitasatospora sp. LaBMicrA B282 TaxID=3420949 RepID=UPI003D121024
MYWAGLLLCALLGGEVGGMLTGFFVSDTGLSITLIVVGANLAPWTGIGGFALLFRGRQRRAALRARAAGEPAEPPRPEPALARIESARATGEGPDIPLRLDLTVAPDGRPGYRAEATVVVNLMDLDDFRTGRIIVVDHDPVRPWNVQVRRNPGAAFAGRIALTKIDSAPPETRQTAPAVSIGLRGADGAGLRLGLLAAAGGLLLSLVAFQGL